MTATLITEPGIVGGLDIEIYHSQCTPGPSFSSSNLRAMELQSPAHCFANWSGNPNRVEKSTKALSFGSAAHALILGDEVFGARHAVSPFQDFAKIETIDGVEWKPRRPDIPDMNASKVVVANYEKAMQAVADGTMAYKSDWSDLQADLGRVVITADDFQHIKNMAEVLHGQERLDGLFGGDVEQSCFWQDEQTGLWLKSRLDVRPLNDVFMDLKTTVDASPHATERDITKRAYDMQFALGTEGLLKAGGQKIHAHVIVFIEKTPPYACTPVEISPQVIWDSARRNRRALDHIKVCLDSGSWPGYPVPPAYEYPRWLQKELDEDEAAGLLPPPPAWLEQLKVIPPQTEPTETEQDIELT